MRAFQPVLTVMSLICGAAVSPCHADTITYNVNLSIGAGGVTGDIVTNGATDPVEPVILDWNLLLNDGTTTFDLTPLNSQLFESPLSQPDLTATASDLMFNFGDSSSSDYLAFADGDILVCFASLSQTCVANAGPNNGAGGESVLIYYGSLPFNPQFTPISGTGVIGTAATSSTPEPRTMLLALAGLVAVVAQFRSRKRRV